MPTCISEQMHLGDRLLGTKEARRQFLSQLIRCLLKDELWFKEQLEKFSSIEASRPDIRRVGS